MNKRPAFYLLLLVSVFPVSVHAQNKDTSLVKKLIQKAFTDTTAPGKPSFRVYPTFAFAPETSLEIGASSLLLFQAKNDTLNRLSELQAFTFFTVNAQYGIWLDNAYYSDKDRWFILGRARFQRFPLLYFGKGPATNGEEESIVDANYFLIRQRLLRKVVPNFFMGAEVDFQSLYNTNYTPKKGSLPAPEGIAGSNNLGFGIAAVYDNRHNVLNVRKGLFGELSFLRYGAVVNGPYTFTNTYLDVRHFSTIKKNNVLAWQVYASVISGGAAPFNMQSLLGGESMMRGYYYGRYRDNVLTTAQIEYRILPFVGSKRWGAATFFSAGTVAPTLNSLHMKYLQVAGGAGLRYLLFPKKDIFLRFDVGVTKEGVNFYLFTGEAF